MIYVCEHHDEVLALWRKQERRDIRLAHVDFHDDLRGMLVDRRRGLAFPLADLGEVDPGNFLAHAVADGRVRSIRWVHGEIGGRAWDAGIVRYESDWFALPGRLRHRWSGGPEHPLDFDEVRIENWDGPRGGELLSIDWDAVASILQERGVLDSRVDELAAKLAGPVPEESYLVYSPEYCHPTLPEFKRFLEGLRRLFDQPVQWLSPALAEGRTTPTDVDPRPPGHLLMRMILALRRRGFY